MYYSLRVFTIFSLWLFSFSCAEVLVPYAWRQVDFLYPSETDRSNAIQDGSFIPQNVILNDLDVWDDPVKAGETGGKRIFVSTPRIRVGIPATVSTVTNVRSGDSFQLSPFPDWSAQVVNTECTGIVSVDKIHIDRCGLLWILDTGRLNEFTNPTRVCQPKILIYDLKNNDNLIERYEIPDGVATPESTITTTVTDSKSDNCRDAIAYIADLNGNGLIVFDLFQRTSWRINHNYFYPYPRYGTYTIAGVTFDLMDGIFGMALGPVTSTGDRTLYFHSLASVRESWVSTLALRNTTLQAQPDLMRQQFHLSPEFREGQSSLEVITDNGILIYSVLPRNALACWNTNTEPIKSNTQILYENNEHLQFISGLKLKGDVLWISTNQVQNQFSNSTNTENYRFRILIVKSVSELLKDSICVNPNIRMRKPFIPLPPPDFHFPPFMPPPKYPEIPNFKIPRNL